MREQYYVPIIFKLLIVTILICLFSDSSSAQGSVSKKEIVVLIHGLGRGRSIMDKMADGMTNNGFSPSALDYPSLGRTPEEILVDVTKKIKAVTSDTARTIHFVGHSLGGLLIRAYLDSNRIPHLGKVVLIGSPSKGTPLVDYFRDAWMMKLAGPIAASLGTDTNSFPHTLRPPYYPVGIIAGISTTFSNEDFIPGDDDGIVPVESTKIEGMTDFLLVKVSHSSLPKDGLVIQQTIEFLKNGKFTKK
jgi:pimeloyl-ACP methyl ester carboxylesterase